MYDVFWENRQTVFIKNFSIYSFNGTISLCAEEIIRLSKNYFLKTMENAIEANELKWFLTDGTQNGMNNEFGTIYKIHFSWVRRKSSCYFTELVSIQLFIWSQNLHTCEIQIFIQQNKQLLRLKYLLNYFSCARGVTNF